MSGLMMIGIGMGVWIGCCLFVVALCASAKEGDEERTGLAVTRVDAPGAGAPLRRRDRYAARLRGLSPR